MPRAGLPCMVSRTCVVRRPLPAICCSVYRPRQETTASRPMRNAHFLPSGPFLCILFHAAGFILWPQQIEASTMRYPRDLNGYGPNPPHANWPGGAHVAVQFVLNYEEGGENNILHGDAGSEA